jgi:hypothetical protein
VEGGGVGRDRGGGGSGAAEAVGKGSGGRAFLTVSLRVKQVCAAIPIHH